jgi:hypothetical protein
MDVGIIKDTQDFALSWVECFGTEDTLLRTMIIPKEFYLKL